MKKLLIISGLFIANFVFAQSIDYPVTELGGCQDREGCRQYCDVLSHAESCLNFAESHKLFTSAELQEARKVVNVLKQGAETPGNCQNKGECAVYCSQREHIRECFNFAKKAGLIPLEEIKRAEKSIPSIEKGESPGDCITKEECDTYCSKDEHKGECMNFALKAGLMTQEEADRYKKTGGKGPGGCQSEAECNTYCDNPENQEECLSFAREHGLLSEEELEKIKENQRQTEEGRERILNMVSTAPLEVLQCLEQRLGSQLVEQIQSGDFTPSPEMGDAVRECFESVKGPQQEPPEQGQGLPPG
jgi:hypothetical protein